VKARLSTVKITRAKRLSTIEEETFWIGGRKKSEKLVQDRLSDSLHEDFLIVSWERSSRNIRRLRRDIGRFGGDVGGRSHLSG